MRKIILIAANAALALSLVACSTESTTSPKDPTAQEQTNQSEEQNPKSVKTFLGQVSDKIGNDITLSLGTFVLDDSDSTGESFIYDGTGEPRPYDGEIDDASGGETLMVPMPDEENGDGNNTSAGKAEKLPIEFTGETKEFTIPAGAKTTNVSGKDVNFDVIKKGSFVQITVNENTGVVESIMVW